VNRRYGIWYFVHICGASSPQERDVIFEWPYGVRSAGHSGRSE